MIKVGITGQSGFVGTHIYNTLGLYPDRYIRIPFDDSFFNETKKLAEFASRCDIIFHLAALNRHEKPEVIYNTNILLVKKLTEACDYSGVTPHILFSSSTQEEKENLYGRSKKEGRELFETWAKKSGSQFTGLVIPNVFGPFGHPYYNSVVATFCYQLTHNEVPEIDSDNELRLIYINELVAFLLKKIDLNGKGDVKKIDRHVIPFTSTIKVSELLEKLLWLKKYYFENGVIPSLSNSFDRNLFNTFLTYIDHKTFFPFHVKMNNDERGSFVELIRLNSGGQVSFSTTKPGITRGNHFHTRKAERFIVIKGRARIEFRRTGTAEKYTFVLNGETPSFVDMPVWFTHNITNIGTEDVYTVFWANEHFDPSDPDTFSEPV